MKKIIVSILLLALCDLAPAESQHHPFYSHYYYDEGLPDVAIQCCVQDDYGRIWIGSRGEGVYFFAGTRFVQLSNEDFLSSCSDYITAIVQDYSQHIWIGTSEGIGRYDFQSNSFTALDGLKGCGILDIDIDAENNVWITADNGIWRYSNKDGSLALKIKSEDFTPFRACVTDMNELAFTAAGKYLYIYDINSESMRLVKTASNDNTFKYIDFVGASTLLVSNGNNTVCTVDTSNGSMKTVVDSDVIESISEVRCVTSKGGLYWIGTTFGLIVYDPATGEIERQFPDELGNSSLGGECIFCLYQDKDGNMWAGTNNGGLRCWMSYEAGFSRFIANGTANSLVGSTVLAVDGDLSGMIWTGSEEGYLCRFDPENKTFKDYTEPSGIPNGIAISDITLIGSHLWIATSGDGIYVFDPSSGRTVKHYVLPSLFCKSVTCTEHGAIYVGTANGLYKFEASSDTFRQIDLVGDTYVSCILEDKQSHLLIGTYGQGIAVYDIINETYKSELLGGKENVTSISFDSKGTLWVTTDGSGVIRAVESSDGSGYIVKRFDKSTGMPSNRSGGVVEDNEGTLWISTTNGLVEFDPDKLEPRKIYMQNDNVLGSRFSFGGDYISEDSEIYLGAGKGLLVFEPQYIKTRFKGAPLHITWIITGYLEKRIGVSQEGRSAITSEEVRIKQKDAHFLTIGFSAMDYSNPNSEKYVSTLTGRGVKSSLTTSNQSINYTNLRPGSYDFTVNYADSSDPSTMTGIRLVILAPFFKSNFAKILYIILGLLAISFFIRNKMKKAKRDNERKFELEQANKEKNLAHEKMDFFTNIAHEIRTPVSVILILLEKLNGGDKVPKEIREDLRSIQMNAERLKKECDDLLDFRKVEKGQARMVFVREDLRAIAGKAVKTFESAAAQRGVTLVTQFPDDPVEAVCDADSIESIVCNILSNAIKYGSSSVTISANDLCPDKAVIRINNDGTPIAEEEREKIFEAFYRCDNSDAGGTGLGLTYSRQLANMNKGRLFVDPEVKDANSFVLILPKDSGIQTDESSKSETDVLESEHINDNVFSQENKASVLVVEDNETMRNLISDELSKSYDVKVACDGAEALEIVRQGTVDLVVSDIMMPRMDGCALCNTIKEDIQLSHIPVLLLTAAVGVETHIRSLRSGADAYIEKPFKMEVLVATISNLFRNRDIRNEQFASYPLSHINYSSFSKVDQDFMNALHNYVTDNISDTDLTIDKLADAMSVSRNTLIRKVKANIGLTVNEYIRISRLKRAVELLTENNYRINEIAYLVGYSSPSYFAKNFQKQFGMLPSEFVKKD